MKKVLSLLLIALVLCTLTGCSAIDGLLRYILSLPTMILNSLPTL